jgi:putative ABC transport system permease protein
VADPADALAARADATAAFQGRFLALGAVALGVGGLGIANVMVVAVLGGFATAGYAATRHWQAVVPVPVLLAAVGLALLIGAAAGLYPALRAARLMPAQALRLS